MKYPISLLLILLSFTSNGQIKSFRKCFVYAGEFRRINHPKKLSMEKTLRKSQVNSTVGATEILVWNVFKRDTQWIALSQNMKNVNLLKLGNLGRIEIKGLKIKADGKNYLIANTKGKCK